MLSSAERALLVHRADMMTALIVLFKSPIPETDQFGRKVLSRVLGTKTTDFNEQIIDITTNPHLSGLSRQGVPTIVWEIKERHQARSHTVLDPISTVGQEVLLDFIGISFVQVYKKRF